MGGPSREACAAPYQAKVSATRAVGIRAPAVGDPGRLHQFRCPYMWIRSSLDSLAEILRCSGKEFSSGKLNLPPYIVRAFSIRVAAQMYSSLDANRYALPGPPCAPKSGNPIC